MTNTPSAKALRDWATENGLPIPANIVIVPLHGDAAGNYEVSTFDFKAQYRYAERVQYIRDLCVKAQGQGAEAQVVEETDKKVTARISLKATTPKPLTDLDTHNTAVALTTRMLTLAAEIRAKQAELEAAVIEHFKLTDEPLYLAWCVFPTPDGYEVVTNPRRFAALQQPPKPLVIKPVVVALDVAKRETAQQYAESQLSLIGEPA